VIADRVEEHLGLMFQATKGFGMEDAVTIALEAGPHGILLFGNYPADALG
jgi:hypothetical protein